MAARTASVSGSWSNTATWGGSAVPVDGDTVTINVGVIVTFDVDQSGFTNGIGASTINGTLKASTVSGSYYWKCNGTVTWSSTSSYLVNNGTGVAYPVGCTFEQHFNGNFSNAFNAATTINIICAEPTHLFAKLSSGISSGATVLPVDTDLTQAGDSGANLWTGTSLTDLRSDRLIISSISSTQITMTSGVTGARSAGEYIILVTRNVRITGPSTASGTAFNGCSGQTIGAQISSINSAFTSVISCTINGVISTTNTCLNSCKTCTVNGPLSNGNVAITSCTYCTMNGVLSAFNASDTGSASVGGNLFTGVSINVAAGITDSGATLSGATIKSSNEAINGGTGYILRNSTFSGNGNGDLFQVRSGVAYNCSFLSATQFVSYNSATFRAIWDYFESINDGNVNGAFKAWCLGGIVSSVASPVFDASRVRSYKHAPESASAYVFRQQEILVPAGGSVYVRCYVQKDASMSYLPRLWVMQESVEPLISGVPDSEVIMSNSTNTWEILETTVTNNTDSLQPYIVRTIAKNASGNVYFDPIIRLSSYQIDNDLDGLAA